MDNNPVNNPGVNTIDPNVLADEPTVDRALPTGGGERLLGDGRYELLEPLGEGPLLTAFRARDRQQNRMVTVRTVTSAFQGNADVQARLRAGLGQVFTFQHPNIARLYDVGLEPVTGAVYTSEEHVRGIDLKERVRRAAPLALNSANDIAIALAEALEYAHARGVTHGDVRPQNVLVGPEGQIKLTGFGIAGAQAAAFSHDAGLRRSVAAYAPPLEPGAIPAPAADVFSLGVILFEALTGDLPFGAEGAASFPASAPVPSPRGVNPVVPPALDGIVVKALGRGAAGTARYASASDLLKDLRAVRDALRFGKPLNWSPVDAGAVPVAAAAAPVAAAPIAAATSVMPSAMPAPMPTAVPPARAAAVETVPPPPAASPDPVNPPMNQDAYAAGPPVRRSMAGKVLVAINLLLGSVFVGLCVYLAYLALYFIQPPQEVIVPNLVGKQLAQAETLARERKFKVEVVDKQFNDKTPEGTILQMRPEPGRHILEGKPISVWVSSGPKMVEVPDVRDVSFEKARVLLEKAGLKLGDRKSEFDPLAARGNVIRQLPEAGENRPRGTRIDLVLSKGPEPLPSYDEPEVIEPTPAPPPPAGGEPDATPADPAEGRTSYLTVGYDIPSDAAPHHIRIDVTDKSGTRTVYDELREPGERLSQDVEGTGKKITIKVYDNDVLVSELSGPPFKQ